MKPLKQGHNPKFDRREHEQDVRSYLQKHFSAREWIFSLPRGSGMETYLVQGNGHEYFVKVGAIAERYLVMAEAGLTPPVLTFGNLESGLSILVQPVIKGWRPSRIDFQSQLEKVAAIIHKMHGDPHLREILKPASSNLHKSVGLQALNHLYERWKHHRVQVSEVADFVDNSLQDLALQINQFTTEGLVVSHNDICNANWLFAADGKIYIIDLESMSIEDPALDMGALLWWYYPSELRQRFLELAGYSYDQGFMFRMRVRMALHCLSITLPRENSFDMFYPERFQESLQDFRAVMEGKENPQGYTV